MYSERLAVAIKSNGKILREHGDIVYVPFGTEYSIFIKNLNTCRACISIEIDGQNVTDDGVIVNANSSIDLERFISNNLNAGNRFKFVERNSAIEQHRGIRAEDGLIRVEFEFEKVYQPTQYADSLARPKTFGPTITWGSGAPNVYYSSVLRGVSQNAVASNVNGITVAGSISSQQFVNVTGFIPDGAKHVAILKLLGERGDSPVKTPLTVKTQQKCITCGHMNKSSSKFCSECGTSLEVVA